jgi:hypothetical protein
LIEMDRQFCERVERADPARDGNAGSRRRARTPVHLLPIRIPVEALPGWVWAVHSDAWEERFSHLKKFSEREGHCRVPQRYKTDDDYRLGLWVANQRKAKDTMEPDRRQRLEALPGWVWKVEK